jgi:hypothetical protein
MGLTVSHDCWDRGYSSFHNFRMALAECNNIDLMEMQGFVEEGKSWESEKDKGLAKFLYHSDCDGYFKWYECREIAESLEKSIQRIGYIVEVGCDEFYKNALRQWADGLMEAYYNYETVIFR